MVQNATIKNVRVDGNITVSNCGDEDEGGTDDCDGIGGIAGRCGGTVEFIGCHNNVNIACTGSGTFAAIGGIVGFQKDGEVRLTACVNTGTVQVNDAQIPAAGFIGTAYSSTANTLTAEANYCYAEVPCVLYGSLHGDSETLVSTVSANYWAKVNGSPENVLTEGFTEITDGSEDDTDSEETEGSTESTVSAVTWQTAMEAMNAYLIEKYPDFGYEYVENPNTEEAVTIPLVLMLVSLL